MKIVLLAIAIVFLSIPCFSQDSLEVLVEKDTVHSVRKAALFSSILPGSGQIYNHIHQQKGQKKAFWKVPMIYSGLGATGYFFVNNQSTVLDLKNEYRNRQNGQAGSTQWSAYDDEGVLVLYQSYSRSRDLSLLGFILIYGIQVADSAVEAHFVDFDISEDLSMSFSPWSPRIGQFGLSMVIKIR
jgi:hypothetical protein